MRHSAGYQHLPDRAAAHIVKDRMDPDSDEDCNASTASSSVKRKAMDDRSSITSGECKTTAPSAVIYARKISTHAPAARPSTQVSGSKLVFHKLIGPEVNAVRQCKVVGCILTECLSFNKVGKRSFRDLP